MYLRKGAFLVGFYNIKIIMKYLYKCLNALFFIICLIILFFLIFLNLHSVSAETIGVDGSAIPETVINNVVSWYEANYADTYDYFTMQYAPADTYGIVNVFNLGDPSTKIIYFSNHIESSTGTATGEYFTFNKSTGQNINKLGDISSYIYNNMRFSNNLPLYYSNLDLYDNNNTLLWVSDYTSSPSFTAPSFVNYEDSNWDGTLVNGEFNYFYIEANDSSRVLVYIYDETYSVGGSLDDGISWATVLDENSEYVLHDSNGAMYWAWSKNDMFGSYQNYHTYQLSFQYLDENDTYQDSQVYRWTTDFSEAVLNGEYDEVLGDINKGLNDINGFLNNSNYDQSSIVNSMPSTNVQDPTENQINNIFTMIRNAFSTNNAQNVVIALPHTDETITIPADLVTSHIPSPILFLIQGFYWYIICRFIIKDISKTVEHAKSGEILDAKDGNIKTDLL